MDEGVGIDAIIAFSKAFALVPHDRLLTKLAASGVDSRVVVWIGEFFVGRSTQRVRVGRKLSKEVKVNSGVPQGSILGSLLFLAYVNDIWRNIDSSIRLFANGCKIYRKITNKNDKKCCRRIWTPWGELTVENGMKINPGESKAIRFTRALVKNPFGYCLGDQTFPEANSFKYLGIILRSDLNWVDQENYTAQKDWKVFHFVMRVLEKVNRNTKSSAYTSLALLILNIGLHARIYA